MAGRSTPATLPRNAPRDLRGPTAPVRRIVLNRAEKRNAFNGELVVAVGEALRAAAADSSIHCVVVRGVGSIFSAGMDLASLGDIAENPRQPARLPPDPASTPGTSPSR